MQLTATNLAERLRERRFNVVAVREGSIDVEGEVQLSNTVSVTVSSVDGSFSIFELLNDDPDNTKYRESDRFLSVDELARAVRVKLNPNAK